MKTIGERSHFSRQKLYLKCSGYPCATKLTVCDPLFQAPEKDTKVAMGLLCPRMPLSAKCRLVYAEE